MTDSDHQFLLSRATDGHLDEAAVVDRAELIRRAEQIAGHPDPYDSSKGGVSDADEWRQP